VAAGWVALTAFVLLGELGPVLRLDQWLLDASPFTPVPKLPAAASDAVPVLVLCLVAAALAAVGQAALRRRDTA
jgi:ABC-2 type transport system permease protein